MDRCYSEIDVPISFERGYSSGSPYKKQQRMSTDILY